MVVNTETNLVEPLQMVAKRSDQKRVRINCVKTECMVVNERNSAICKLKNGYTKIKQVRQFKYPENVFTKDGMRDTIIRSDSK